MKILIVYASAGAGHKKAAEAVYEALLEKVDKREVQIVDSLDHANKFFRWLYSKKYLTLVSYMPGIWGFFYHLLDNWLIYRLFWLPRRIINSINCRGFEYFLCRQRPEIIITTHFMANEIVSRLKERNRLSCALFCAVTDYRMHSFWVASRVDRYFVATDQTKKDLLIRGVLEDKISVTGVPISHKFSARLDKIQTRDRLILDRNLFTILIIGGGFGVGPLEGLVSDLCVASGNVQFLIVCGYNRTLYERVNKIISNSSIKAKVYGFVDNVHELMSCCDLLVTKSGGLTSSEALAKGLPIIFIKPIPGQEKRNSLVLQDKGAAFIAKDVNSACRKVAELFNDAGRLEKMAESALGIARPDSARDIADWVIRRCM